MSIEKVLCIYDEEIEAIRKKRGKSEDEIQKDIAILRTWFMKQAHLPQNVSDQTLQELLYHCKYRIEKAKSKLDAYFSIPHLYPEFYEDRSAFNPRIQECFEKMIFVFLPKLSDNLERITVLKEMSPFSDLLAKMIVILIMSDLVIGNELNMSKSIILDFEHTNMAVALSVNPLIIFKFLMILEKGYMPTIGTIHVVNMPSYGVSLFNTVKNFMKKKYWGKMHIHENYEELHKFFPKKILPTDYLGEEKSLREIQADWIEVMKERDEWLQNKKERYSNESLRIGPALENDILGIQGTFKQLNVD